MNLFLAFGIILIGFNSCSQPPVMPPRQLVVTTQEAIQCDTYLHLDYVGHVEAFSTVQLVPQVQGYLTNYYVGQGVEVEKDELIATIDDRPYRATLAQAEATLAQTIAQLRYSEDAVHRYAKLVQDDFVSQLDFDNYVTTVLSNEAVVQQNLAQIESAKLNVDYCYLSAPMKSIIGLQFVKVGNFIPAGSTNPIATLNQIQPIYVNFSAPEDDLSRIRALQNRGSLTTRVFLEGNPAPYYDGLLTMIDNQVDETTGSILLQSTFSNEDKALWPGQFVSIRVFLEEVQGAILVPAQAVQMGQTGAYLFVVKPDTTVERRSVKKGQKEGDLVVIESGVAAGESVVVEGQLNLYPGAKVVIRNEQTITPTFDNGQRDLLRN